jgi:ferritin-like metal-binding protein YciE
MKLESLHELFLTELRDMYDAEHQIVKALPKMIDKAGYPELKAAFSEHLEQTQNQVTRLEEIFENLGEKAKAEKCKGMKGILDEGEDLAGESGDPAAIDAGIISSAQKVEHYEISSYGSLCSWAKTMGHQRELQLLQQNLEEEKAADQKLTQLAERMVNVDAVRTAGGSTRGEL